MNKDVEDDKQSCVIVKCEMCEDKKKNVSNETKEIVSIGNNKSPQTSNEENEDSPLSSNKLARKIECTSEMSNDEIIKKLSDG
ncbi:13150_t:CDS:2 [Racocetra persica]|uniref:13150_t:CDS:1 n=1 Tax=Racocetra persica TaxID=160502 RepID=A0ACA9NT19_9GLOM|nr:13150_t:CDS:2 [Racocetra persica]